MQERQIGLLEALHQNKGYMTAKALADTADCSLQTVRNDIRHLRQILESVGLGTIESKSNKGFCLQETEDWNYILKTLKHSLNLEVHSDGNFYRLCEVLLKKRKVQMNHLEDILLVGRTGVEKYVELVHLWMTDHEIVIERKRGQGLQIKCDEYAWRIALFSLFCEIPKSRDELGKKSLTARIEHFLWGFDTKGVVESIAAMEDIFGFRFSFDSYQQLLFFISLSVIRIRSKAAVVSKKGLEYEGKEYDWKLAAFLIQPLEQYYHFQIPEEEYEFLLFSVSISEIQDFYNLKEQDQYEKANQHIGELVIKIMATSGNILNVDFLQDEILKNSLFRYLKTILLRLRFHLNNQNPFLYQIKTRYPNIYTAVWSAGMIVEAEAGQALGENEVAYLALYFGGAVERLNVNTAAYILCNYGIGISQIIRDQVEKSIPNLTIIDVITTRDYFKVQRKNCDFFISTVPIGNIFAGKDVLEIGNMLQPQDVRMIQEKIHQIRKSKMKRIATKKSGQEKQLFHEELIFTFKGSIPKEELLQTIWKEIIGQGYASENLTDAVLRREQVTSTVLSNRVAIPHGMADCVIEPAIAIGILEEPIRWDGNNQVDRVFLLSLNLDDKFHAKTQIIRFYSALVSLLEDEKEYDFFWHLKDKKEILNYLNMWINK